MKYLHKLSAVSGTSPKNIVSDTSPHIHRYAKYCSHFVYHMWSGPHMLIPGAQADRASAYANPSIYTLLYRDTHTYTHTHTVLHDKTLYIRRCGLIRQDISKILFVG